ncbi:hypothetical protein BDZ85DRAFT_266940 [Elsinoe ampelina]|uniref:Uncharacterized protein n=1 Tax=Elsinoe ampelina TaxID=302913 RepID=A0A6A6G4I5_9PEZI|nr:hypothetical protein BDZ85DRAFT_266940 [Elsinoe ampelina]
MLTQPYHLSIYTEHPKAFHLRRGSKSPISNHLIKVLLPKHFPSLALLHTEPYRLHHTKPSTMAAAPTDSVYQSDNIAVPLEVQDHFSSQYNMDDPEQARLCYMRVMHEHTKQQFQMATASSRRRNSPATHDMASLTTESSNGSVSSTSS